MSFQSLRSRAPQLTTLISLFIVFLASPSPHTGLALAQWSTPVRISEAGDCWYPQIQAQGDTLHVVYSNERGGWKISYVRSSDAGQTWSAYQVLSDTLNTTNTQFPRIIAHNQRLMAVWTVNFLQGVCRYNISYSISDNNGASWLVPRYVLNPNWPLPVPMVASGADSVVNLMMSTWTGDSTGFFNIRSTNFGQTWSSPRSVFHSAFTGVPDQASRSNVVYYFWAGGFDPQDVGDIYLITSLDQGVTWTSNVPISEIDRWPSQRPSVATATSGNAQISWWDFKYSPYWTTGDILVRTSSDEGENWTPELQITYRHFATLSDVGSDDSTSCVVWQDQRPENGHFSIYFSESRDGGQSWSEEFRLDGDSLESRQPAVAASNGRVYVIWADRRCDPDTDICGGIYFTKCPAEPDGVRDAVDGALPRNLGLSAYPNPFNSQVVITYTCAKGGDITIVNALGQLARVFKIDAAIGGEIEWDGTDQTGHQVSSGIYFAKLQSGGRSKALKIIRVK